MYSNCRRLLPLTLEAAFSPKCRRSMPIDRGKAAVGALGVAAAGTTAAGGGGGGGIVDKRVQRLAAALLSQAVGPHSPQVGECNAGGSDNDSQNSICCIASKTTQR